MEDVEKDGNCLFRALALQLGGIQTNHGNYRRIAGDSIKDNKKAFTSFAIKEEDSDIYVEKILRDTEWDSSIELWALQLASKIEIKIIKYEQRRHDTNPGLLERYLKCSLVVIPSQLEKQIKKKPSKQDSIKPEDKKTIYLAFINENYYTAVVSKNNFIDLPQNGFIFSKTQEEDLENANIKKRVIIPRLTKNGRPDMHCKENKTPKTTSLLDPSITPLINLLSSQSRTQLTLDS